MSTKLWIPNAILQNLTGIMPLEQVVEQDSRMSVARLDNVGYLGKLSPGGKHGHGILVRLGSSSHPFQSVAVMKPGKHSEFPQGILFIGGSPEPVFISDKSNKGYELVEVGRLQSVQEAGFDAFVRQCADEYSLLGAPSRQSEQHLVFYQPSPNI